MNGIDVAAFAAGWQAAWPGIVVGIAAFLVMAADLASRGPDRDGTAVVGIAGLLVAVAVAMIAWGAGGSPSGFRGVLLADRFGLFFTVLVCVGAALTILMSVEYVREQRLPAGDYFSLVLLSTFGMVFMVLANDLIVVFLALEIMSVGVYCLSGILRSDVRSGEAAMKYFLLGAFASGFLLYGIAFFYAATGSTRLDAIGAALAHAGASPFMLLGIAFVTVGFGFKVALIPFQGWTPDVYEGAPTAITAFMAAGVKAAAFAAFARTFWTALQPASAAWTDLLWWLAVLTMSAGNLLAVTQRNVKRMLAYSSIAHAGYALVGLVVANRDGGAALCFYLAVYVVMTIGSFGVLLALGRRGEPHETLDDLGAVGFRHPVLGLSMLVFMLSLAGIPPTAGFAGKFWLFSSAVDAGYVGLAVIGVLNSLVSVYYYLGVIVRMYMTEGQVQIVPPRARPCLLAVILVTVVGTLALGVFPSRPMALARAAFASLR
jgi:NADH-quinone oxidoreductase subunit N